MRSRLFRQSNPYFHFQDVQQLKKRLAQETRKLQGLIAAHQTLEGSLRTAHARIFELETLAKRGGGKRKSSLFSKF